MQQPNGESWKQVLLKQNTSDPDTNIRDTDTLLRMLTLEGYKKLFQYIILWKGL